MARTYQSPRLDQFADLISGGKDERLAIAPRDAAERMGYDRRMGDAMMQKLRKRLGAQAV